ncbi:phosphate ABC transporter permease subunit PstC [Bacteroidales bacterium OttesenSCG-928-J19]|nr:phosphate ABC transporter permease subunit PstC [Bacteroidales bacterium OttesenSCG-928-J19]
MRRKDKILHILLSSSAIITFLLIAGILYTLFSKSLPIFRETGIFNLLATSNWSVVQGAEKIGILGFVMGTIKTSLIALVICIPFSLSIALFCGDLYRGTKLAGWISGFFQIMVYIPSILLGVWGYHCLRPILIQLNIGEQGFGIFTAGLVLALMIIPPATTISLTFFNRIPNSLRECALSFGATRLDITRRISLPFVKKGFVYSYLFALSKVIGEVMIVVLLVGNSFNYPLNWFETGSTMTSVVLAQFGESNDIKQSALFAILLLLFIFTAIINYLTGRIIKRELS